MVFPVLHTSSSKDLRLLIKQASAAISQRTCSESGPVFLIGCGMVRSMGQGLDLISVPCKLFFVVVFVV